MRGLLVLAGMGALALAGPAQAQPAGEDGRVADALQLFQSFCIGEAGLRDRALAVLGDSHPMASRLPAELVTSLQAGVTGGVAWAMAGPNGSQLLLGYTASGICEVRIADADEAAVQKGVATLAAAAAEVAGAELKTAPAEKRTEAGATLTFQTYAYPFAGKSAQIALTTSDKRVGAQQHLISFAIVP